MRLYRVIWRCLAGLLSAVGAAAAVIVVLPGTMLTLFACVGMVAGLVTASVYATRAETGQAPPHPARRICLSGALAGFVAVAVAGLLAVLGVSALLLVLAVAAVSPAAVGYLPRQGSRRRPEAGANPAPTAPAAPAGRSNAELCRAWRDSFDDLRVAASPAARLRIVEARQSYLDELERRDPDGFHAWLESTASPAGDPARFVGGDHG